jgi:hypothetical protein
VRAIKLWWVIAAFLSGVAVAMWAEELNMRALENRLEFSAPQVHFLTGRPLELLRNAKSVPYDFVVTLWAGSPRREIRRNAVTFVISYDIWEERYSVTKVQPRKAAAHLTQPEAEAWCLQEMAMDVTGVAPREPLWADLEIRAADGRDSPLFGPGNITDTGVNITGLIEFFARARQTTPARWTLQAGPVTLEQLRTQARQIVRRGPV